MEKKLVIYNNSVDKIVINGNRPINYKLHSGRLINNFYISELLSDEKYFMQTYHSGYDNYEKKYMSDYDELYRSIEKKFYIPISKNFIEFYKLNWNIDRWDWSTESWSKDIIELSNTHLNEENVESFYEFSLEVEIDGILINGISNFGDTEIEFTYPKDNEELKVKMINMFGEPKVHPQNEGDKYGKFAKNYFFVPKSRIDKIIGIKKFRDISSIGKEDGEQFTGETEEIILDPHNFDENVYKIFKDHGMLEIEGY